MDAKDRGAADGDRESNNEKGVHKCLLCTPFLAILESINKIVCPQQNPAVDTQGNADTQNGLSYRYMRQGNKKGELQYAICVLKLSIGAGDRDRTGTLFTARDFKSLVSACSTTPTSFISFYHLFIHPSRRLT